MPISLNGLTFAAEDGRDILRKVIDRFTVRREVAPDVVARRLVYVGNVLKQRISVRDHTFVVIGALRPTIVNLPGLLEVIRPDCCRRPYVTFTGHFAGIEKVVEHTELQRQLVFVRRDGCAVHCELRITVAHWMSALFKIAEDLIVSSVLLDDVNHMPNWIAARSKRDAFLSSAHPVAFEHRLGRRLEAGVDLLLLQ